MTVKYAVQSHVHDVIEWRSSGNGNTIRRRKSNFTAERSLAGRELDTPRAPPQRPAMPCQSHAPLARGEVLILIPRASARRSISTLLTIAPLLDAQWCEVKSTGCADLCTKPTQCIHKSASRHGQIPVITPSPRARSEWLKSQRNAACRISTPLRSHAAAMHATACSNTSGSLLRPAE
jgi:hypothetical protein